MPKTLGAATGDDVTLAGGLSVGSRPGIAVVGGWFRPTTLTAGRQYISTGSAAFRAQVGATTSDILVFLDRSTDQQQIVTAGIVVDEWHFIFMLVHSLSSDYDAVKCWVGTPSRVPELKGSSVSVAGSGNPATSATYCVGNTGTGGTAAFQGDVADVFLMQDTDASNMNWIGGIAAGVASLTAADEARVYRKLVLPIWAGGACVRQLHQRPRRSNVNSGWYAHYRLGSTVGSGTVYDRSAGPNRLLGAATSASSSGAVSSLQAPPRFYPLPEHQPPARRRR